MVQMLYNLDGEVFLRETRRDRTQAKVLREIVLFTLLASISGVGAPYTSTLCPTRKVQKLLSSRNSNSCRDPIQPPLLLYSRWEIAGCGALSIRDSHRVC